LYLETVDQISRKKLPERHDFVIGVVSKIQKHGVYVELKEYVGVVGYCHISEVAGAWIRNIRNFVRIDQNVVAKVLRVSHNGQVDISLKRVSDQLKREKIQEYKRQNSAIAMVRLVSERSKKSAREVREIIEDPLTETYGSMYDGFEELAAVGVEAVANLGFSDDLVTAMHEIAETSIQVNTIAITCTLGIRSFAPDGVEQVKLLLQTAEDTANNFPEVKSEITSIGSPVYRIYLEGWQFDEVENVYQKIKQAVDEKGSELQLEYKLERDN
jgi:translation initiation factor 2 subunit 1